MSKDDEVRDMSLAGALLYVVALTFLLGDLMAVTFMDSHLDGDIRYRMGITFLVFGGFLAFCGWVARRFAYRLASAR